MKRIALLVALIFFHLTSVGQIKIENEVKYTPWYYDHEFDSVFNVNKNNEFEIRVITEPSTLIPGRKLKVFIMTLDNKEWKARYLQRFGYPKDEYLELKVDTIGLPNLWNALLKLNILAVPESYLLTDKEGAILSTNVKDGVTYIFELTTKNAKRNYSYYCPEASAKEFPKVKAFRQVSKMIELIDKYCEAKYN